MTINLCIVWVVKQSRNIFLYTYHYIYYSSRYNRNVLIIISSYEIRKYLNAVSGSFVEMIATVHSDPITNEE